MTLRAGAALPSFEGTLSDGTAWKSSAPREGPLVLFFYPKDFTAGWTKEACGFRDACDDLQGRLGAEIIGVSRDPVETHARFRAEHRLPFPLLSDPDGSFARRMGALHLGGLLPLVKRISFVIDAKGIVRGAFHHEFAIGRHVRRVRDCLESLQGKA